MRKIDTRDFRRATRTTSREINRRIVLNLVRDHQPVSRADLEKAQDGRVGAQIRIVIGGQSRDRKRKGDEQDKEDPKKGSDVLDRLGY